MAASNGIFHQLERKAALSHADPERYTNIQRAAASLSRRNVDAAITELLNEAFARLVVLCYEKDDDARLCNVDIPTGKILVPLPFGKAGHKKWGLTPSEADVLRAIMLTRQEGGVPLFFFDRNYRAWFLNLKEYADLPVLSEWQVTLEEYRRARIKGSKKGGR